MEKPPAPCLPAKSHQPTEQGAGAPLQSKVHVKEEQKHDANQDTIL